MKPFCRLQLIFKLTALIVLINPINQSHAVSSAGEQDGLVHITIKDNHPCFYLDKDNTYVKTIAITHYNRSLPNGEWRARLKENNWGMNAESCIKFQAAHYDTAYRVILGEHESFATSDRHTDYFCLEKKNEQIRLVKTKSNPDKNSSVNLICSDEDWKPYQPSFWKRFF